MFRILMVEDDTLLQKLMGEIFTFEGYEFMFCPDGKSALETIPIKLPDLIIMDVHLPDMTGHQICRAIKSDSRTRHIPVIMLTGEARELENRVDGLNAGADDYLFKPISTKVLIARVQSLLKLATKPS